MIEMSLGIEPRTSLRWHSHSRSIVFSSPYQSQGEESDSNRRQQFLDRSSPLRLALGYLRNKFDQTAHLNLQRHLYAGVVSFHSEASTNTVNSVDAKLPDSRSGGAGVGGSDHNKGDGESDDHKRKMAISMSQKFTLGYAALLGVGGVMGYLKGGSQKSLLAGGLSASLLYYVYTELPERPAFASSVGLGISGALCGVMGARYKRTGKVFPAVGGVMGYLKGGSQKSLLAGGLSASLLYCFYTELPERPAFASSVGIGVSYAISGVMESRYRRTGNVFPAGVVSLLSLAMPLCYWHVIWHIVK